MENGRKSALKSFKPETEGPEPTLLHCLARSTFRFRIIFHAHFKRLPLRHGAVWTQVQLATDLALVQIIRLMQHFALNATATATLFFRKIENVMSDKSAEMKISWRTHFLCSSRVYITSGASNYDNSWNGGPTHAAASEGEKCVFQQVIWWCNPPFVSVSSGKASNAVSRSRQGGNPALAFCAFAHLRKSYLFRWIYCQPKVSVAFRSETQDPYFPSSRMSDKHCWTRLGADCSAAPNEWRKRCWSAKEYSHWRFYDNIFQYFSAE